MGLATSQNKEKFEDYEGFVEKFKPKKTTDDCYTPPLVYEAVADWVANEYKLDKTKLVRPFFPNGDYEKMDYSGGIVVDNPPFSILSKIVRFYVERDIKFFLFAPTLTSCRYGDFCTVLPIGVDVEYENGAVVCTSFVTNLEPHKIRARTSPTLYKAIDEANRANKATLKNHIPKYIYPLELVTTAAIYSYARYGIEFVVPRSSSVRVSALDSQRADKKTIFGCGWLVSEQVKAEREKAERWTLSKRELEIIAKMTQAQNEL